MPVTRPESVHIGGWLASLDRQVAAGELPMTTKRTYEWGFAQFLDWLDHQQTDEVNEALIRHWIKSLEAHGHNSFSIGFWMDCVTSFFSWAHEAGALPANPALGVFNNGLSGKEDRQVNIRSDRGALVVE